MTARPSRVRWNILLVLMVVSFVSYLLRGNLSIAAPAMMAELQLGEVEWGWVMAAFPLGYALFQLPGGVWSVRRGPRRVLALITLAWALLIALSSLVPGPALAGALGVMAVLLILQFLVGACHAPVYPAMAQSIGAWFPRGGWAWPNGVLSSALTVGLAATAAALPALIAAVGWRWAFVCMAPAGLLAAGLWWWYGRDRPQEHPACNAAECTLIAAGGAETPTASSTRADWRLAVRHRDNLLLTLSYACMNFVYFAVFSWGYYYLVEVRGFGEQEAGFLTAAQWLCAGVGAALGGWLCDRLCRRWGLRWGCRVPVVLGMLVSAVLLLGVAWHPDPGTAALLLGVCFFFNQLTEAPYWAASIAIGGAQAGVSSGLMNTGANLMGCVNAVLLAQLAAWLGWPWAMATAAGFAVLGAALMLRVRADQVLTPAA